MSDNILILDSSEVEKILATKELSGQIHVPKRVLVDSSGAFVISHDRLAIAEGVVPGHGQMNKFGENPDVDNGSDHTGFHT